MFEFQNVTIKRYNLKMLNNFNLSIEPGTLLGILGDNNLSRSLLMQVGAGVVYPDAGDVLIDGVSVLSHYKEMSKKIGYMPAEYGFAQQLTVEEYYRLFLSLRKIYGRYQKKRTEEILTLLKMEEYRKEFIQDIPEEKKPFLYLGQTILHSPEWIFLEDPFVNMTSHNRYFLSEILLSLQDEGVTIIINSGLYPEIRDLFTDIAVIEDGKIGTTGHVYDVYENALKQRPVHMQVLSGMEHALNVLKANVLVDRVTIDGMHVIFRFNGGEREEAELLSALIQAGALIQNYSRDVVNLEEIFQETRLS